MKSAYKFKNGRYVENKTTIGEHLRRIDQNSPVKKMELNNLIPKVKRFFIACGYPVSAQDSDVVNRFIKLIFKTQGNRCGHYLQTSGDQINGVWNNPGTKYKHWHSNWINYEIDHVRPINCGGEDSLENAQFLSPNANRFVKCSMTNEQLLRRVDLSVSLKERIINVQKRRAELFESDTWKNFINLLNEIDKKVLDKPE